MQSLRSRKQAPQQQQPSLQKSKSNARAPSTRRLAKPADSRKSRVDDKIKKRMTMRYADISAPTALDGVPAIPTVPAGVGQGVAVGRDQEEVVQDKGHARTGSSKAAEMKMLDDKSFDPDAFLKLKLANSTEAELRSLQSSLQNTRLETSTDIQRNVFKNYEEFVHISKEISTLENEMLELKESLSDWKNMPSLLHIDENASVAERRRNIRSSIADLRVLYASQMQSLHTQIEGSAKFVPTVPGRHVVSDVEDGVFALNAATYKSTHAVRFVLLDDAVLVARRKQRREGADKAGRWTAERCWLLSEMLVLDTKDQAQITNVFKIRHGKETHVYRTDVPSDKKQLLLQLRHVAEEFAAKRRKEREGEHERRKTMFMGGGAGGADGEGGVPAFPEWMADLAQRAGVPEGSGTKEKEKAERDARWVGDWADGLTVAIALREWEKAALMVAEGEARLPITPALASKLPALSAQLTAALLSALSAPTNGKTTVVRLIALLTRLRAGSAARRTFLAARGEVLRRRIRALRFGGSLEGWVHDLAVIVFTAIKHTADWFLASFRENEVASGFIEWAKIEMENFASMFRRHVYATDVDPATVAEAKRNVYVQSKKLLEEYGLDFRYLLDDLLSEHPKDDSQSTVRPPLLPLRRHSQPKTEPIRTPASTPVRSRSPVPAVRAPSPPRTSLLSNNDTGDRPSPQRAVTPSSISRAGRPPPLKSPTPSNASNASTIPPVPPSPTPNGPRSMVVSPTPSRGALSVNDDQPLRPVLRPTRSAARPSSSASQGHARPPPVAVPRYEGMI